MQRQGVLYFLSFYNDVDHAGPVINSQLKDGVPVHVICNSQFDIRNDVRFRYFTRFSNFHYHPLRALPRTLGTANETRVPLKLWQKISREILFNRWWAVLFLAFHRIRCVVFTWGRPKAKGIQRRVFEACEFSKVRAVCVPHGQNIYKNYDVNSMLRKQFEETGRWPNFSDRDDFDRYIVQTERHLLQHRAWGMGPDKLVAAGSPRFLPTWISFNRSLIQDSNKSIVSNPCETCIVFFLPHWRYNVDYDATISLILRLAAIEDVEILVKGHTRGDAVEESTISKVRENLKLHWNSPEESPILIDRADVVINFGSSIAIEAIATATPVIYPRYLHSNETIFDDRNIACVAESDDQVIEFIERQKKGLLRTPSSYAVQRFLNTEVFNNMQFDEHVIRFYRDEIEAS